MRKSCHADMVAEQDKLLTRRGMGWPSKGGAAGELDKGGGEREQRRDQSMSRSSWTSALALT
jgi:hypothetical protein